MFFANNTKEKTLTPDRLQKQRLVYMPIILYLNRFDNLLSQKSIVIYKMKCLIGNLLDQECLHNHNDH